MCLAETAERVQAAIAFAEKARMVQVSVDPTVKCNLVGTSVRSCYASFH